MLVNLESHNELQYFFYFKVLMKIIIIITTTWPTRIGDFFLDFLLKFV